MKFSKIASTTFLVAAAAVCSFLTLDAAAKQARPYGDVQVLATFPAEPGFPEGIAVKGNRVYVSGPARFGTAGTGPSTVVAYNRDTGALERTYTTQGEALAFEHANSCIAFDGQGRLYVLNIQLGMYRIDTGSGQQESYSTPFPDLPACDGNNAPCSPTFFDAPALPNDIAFDEDGNAYVTDSLQATIWRVPAGGGTPQVYFQDARLGTVPNGIGANGIRLSPDRSKLFVVVSIDPTGMPFIYTLPLVTQPQASDLAVFKAFAPGDIPDGIAFGKSSNLYVAIATPGASGVVILNTSGSEVGRLTNPVGSPFFPYDSPASIAFDGHGSILLSNHAFATMIPSNFTVLDVYVGDKGSPLSKPDLP
ncbi:MAG TPA: SMP-30/gluconolactonase/LRE family protein [Pyrinomonadaceae bacterium]|nr:SMP-30/gluconolactonase/LRE family protein [Pyrinomonadaceae bacterium]